MVPASCHHHAPVSARMGIRMGETDLSDIVASLASGRGAVKEPVLPVGGLVEIRAGFVMTGNCAGDCARHVEALDRRDYSGDELV